MLPVRVRFAPSPTGYLHIGSVRTALFNYLFAKSQNGKFLLRIEDTDLERSKLEFEREIIASLQWLGLKSDEEMVKQSSHFSLYAKIAQNLVEEEKAFISKEKGGSAILFKMPKTRVAFEDLVHGLIEFDTSTFDDLVLMKSDGSPTYNFACVVDDHEMAVSQVIRGDDHISNTPKQILLYEALGHPVPQFAHLPLILASDGAPLSKRHGAVSLKAYQEEGFLPEGLLNYLALLGWSPGNDQEAFTLKELGERFRIDQVNPKSAFFDKQKLRWLNGKHFRMLDDETYQARLADYIRIYGGFEEADLKIDLIRRAALLFKGRVKTFKEFLEQADYFFREGMSFDQEAIRKYWKEETVKENLQRLGSNLKEIDFRDPVLLEKRTRETAEELGVKASALIHPLRVSLTGRSVSPGLFELMSALGKDIVLERIRYATEHFLSLKEKARG